MTSIHIRVNFYSIGRQQGRMKREDIDGYLNRQAIASFNGKVLTITSQDGTPLHTAQVGLFHRREIGDWCNEFNKRRQADAR